MSDTASTGKPTSDEAGELAAGVSNALARLDAFRKQQQKRATAAADEVLGEARQRQREQAEQARRERHRAAEQAEREALEKQDYSPGQKDTELRWNSALSELGDELELSRDHLEFLGRFSEEECARLVLYYRQAGVAQNEAVNQAVDRALALLPSALRGRVRRILTGGKE